MTGVTLLTALLVSGVTPGTHLFHRASPGEQSAHDEEHTIAGLSFKLLCEPHDTDFRNIGSQATAADEQDDNPERSPPQALAKYSATLHFPRILQQ